MSASSCWVTCGMETQLRCRNPPESFLMRESALVSTGPNFAKSTCGHSGRSKLRPPRAGAAAAGAPRITPFTNSWTSAWVMRPFGPEPLTRTRSTPNLRTEGLACGTESEERTGSAGGGAGLPIGTTGAAGARAGTGETGAAATGSGDFFGAGVTAAGAPAAASSSSIKLPFETLSPALTRNSFTTPAAGEGISIVALSDSTVMSDCSGWTTSPALTSTSMMSTSLKSPMSGTEISLVAMKSRMCRIGPARRPGVRSNRHRVGFFRIETILADRIGNELRLDLTALDKRRQRRDRHVVAIDLEEAAQFRAGIRAAVAVGAEHLVDAALRNERADLLGKSLEVVGRGDDRTGPLLEALAHIGDTGLHLGVQHVPALGREPVTAQLRHAGRAPDVRGNAPVGLEQLARGDDFTQDCSRAEQLNPQLFLRPLAEQVHALEDRLLRTRGHRGVLVILVHYRDVVEHVLLLGDHAAQAVLDDDRNLVAESGIVGNAVWHDRGEYVAVPVLVLQPFAVQSGTARGRAEKEATRPLVTRGPDQIAHPLHTEHRVEDEKRHHRKIGMAVRGGRRDPGRE